MCHILVFFAFNLLSLFVRPLEHCILKTYSAYPFKFTAMRSIPPPRQSRLRTIRRLFHVIVASILKGHITDPSVFRRSRRLRYKNTISKIRQSRLSGKATSRQKLRSRLAKKVVNSTTDVLIADTIDENKTLSKPTRNVLRRMIWRMKKTNQGRVNVVVRI